MAIEDDKTCFIIMPITTPGHLVEQYRGETDHFGLVLAHLFKPAVEALGYKAIGPASAGSEVILARIVKYLVASDLVLCDISTHNPNVFFELGVRIALDKPVALVKDVFTQKIPFDTGIINCHTYDSPLKVQTIKSEIPRLSEHLRETVGRAADTMSLWRSFGVAQQAEPTGPASRDDKLALVVRMLEGLSQRLAGPSAGGVRSGRPSSSRILEMVLEVLDIIDLAHDADSSLQGYDVYVEDPVGPSLGRWMDEVTRGTDPYVAVHWFPEGSQ